MLPIHQPRQTGRKLCHATNSPTQQTERKLCHAIDIIDIRTCMSIIHVHVHVSMAMLPIHQPRQTERKLCHATDSPTQLLKMCTYFLEALLPPVIHTTRATTRYNYPYNPLLAKQHISKHRNTSSQKKKQLLSPT